MIFDFKGVHNLSTLIFLYGHKNVASYKLASRASDASLLQNLLGILPKT